jgi:hypothetical protein
MSRKDETAWICVNISSQRRAAQKVRENVFIDVIGDHMSFMVVLEPFAPSATGDPVSMPSILLTL